MATLSQKQAIARYHRLVVNGEPKYVRCYDNGGTSADRYTVIYPRQRDGYTWFVAMSEDPYHPQGVCIHDAIKGAGADLNKWGFSPAIGRKSIFGKRIRFADLPEKCRQVVWCDYNETWRLPNGR